MFEIIFIVGAIVFGVSYMAVVGFFLYYHNQMFNYVMYRESNMWSTPKEDTIDLDELVGELKEIEKDE